MTIPGIIYGDGRVNLSRLKPAAAAIISGEEFDSPTGTRGKHMSP